MSHPVATYSFLPWLRQGLANNINEQDNPTNIKIRATATVTLEIAGTGGGAVPPVSISKPVELFGPGDIVGVDTRAIIRHDPRNWITNYEPNYLPNIEFYDEDFPWRYTPAAPNGQRLRPWLTLVVLKEGEFEEGANVKDRPLPFIKVTDAASKFPPPDQLWAWAHVHANQPLANDIVSNNGAAAATALQGLLDENPDFAYSRIVCPRRLEPNAPYHAFLIPTFESGRLAGLGLDPADPAYKDDYYATLAGWQNHDGYTRPEAEFFPVYFRWYFRTGTVGDFEYLVRLLEPKPVDVRVGARDMDVQTPGSNLPAINTPADLGGFLKLGGALQVPQDTLKKEDKAYFEKYEKWDAAYPHPFQRALAELLNLADDYAQKTTAQAHEDVEEDLKLSEFDNVGADPDPVITPPIYGRWHAKTERLLFKRKEEDEDDWTLLPNTQDWIHEANLDPRFRVPSGFGTNVVQKNQEEYMDAAWTQIGKVLEANRKIRQAQLAKETSFIWYDRHLKPLIVARPEKAMAFMAPVQSRVVTAVGSIAAPGVTAVQGMSQSTVKFLVQNSVVPPVLTSAPMRRVVRPRSRLMKTLDFSTGAATPDNLLTRINIGEITPAPPKTAPSAVPTLDDLTDVVQPKNIPAWLINLLKKHPWVRFIPLGLALIILLLIILLAPAAAVVGILTAVAGGLLWLFFQTTKWLREVNAADSVSEEKLTPEAVDKMPKSPDFRITEPGATFRPSRGGSDSVEAVRFKTALKDVNTVLVASKSAGAAPVKVKLNLPALVQTTFQAINPEVTIPGRIRQGIFLPAHIIKLLGEKFDQVWGYPEFDIPMYEPLVKISDELFLPNINLIEQNSITLLQTNRRFIEAYMLGLNHEFARELLWREYPTDQRGSYFRQFWDVKGMMKPNPGMSDEQWKEILRDISPIHRWRDPLGQNDKPTEGEKIRENIVLVIRGELLKKYPTAVIYAHKAKWQLNNDGTIDNTVERRLEDLTLAQEENPPRSIVKTPLFEAKVDPDIYFFGFDLEPLEARGGTGETQADLNNPGWFFVIKERPGEPRFGLDDNPGEETLNTWNDMTWKRALGGTDTAGAFIQITNATPTLSLTEPEEDSDVAEKRPQWEDDQNVSWSKNMNSADLAYILFQAPVMVAVHAAEMLPRAE